MIVSFLVAILVFRGRHILDVEGFPKRRFNLGKFGYVINVLALFFVCFTSGKGFELAQPDRAEAKTDSIFDAIVFFTFPPAIPVTAVSMNYVICVVFLILGISGATWLLKGKKHYTGPKDIDGLLALARYGLQLGQVVDEDQLAARHAEKFGQPIVQERMVE